MLSSNLLNGRLGVRQSSRALLTLNRDIDLIKFDYIHPKASLEDYNCDSADSSQRGVDCNLPQGYSNFSTANPF